MVTRFCGGGRDITRVLRGGAIGYPPNFGTGSTGGYTGDRRGIRGQYVVYTGATFRQPPPK